MTKFNLKHGDIDFVMPFSKVKSKSKVSYLHSNCIDLFSSIYEKSNEF